MNITEIYHWIEQERNKARMQKLNCNPCAELHSFKYYQGRQEAYENCLDALRELATDSQESN